MRSRRFRTAHFRRFERLSATTGEFPEVRTRFQSGSRFRVAPSGVIWLVCRSNRESDACEEDDGERPTQPADEGGDVPVGVGHSLHDHDPHRG